MRIILILAVIFAIFIEAKEFETKGGDKKMEKYQEDYFKCIEEYTKEYDKYTKITTAILQVNQMCDHELETLKEYALSSLNTEGEIEYKEEEEIIEKTYGLGTMIYLNIKAENIKLEKEIEEEGENGLG